MDTVEVVATCEDVRTRQAHKRQTGTVCTTTNWLNKSKCSPSPIDIKNVTLRN